MLSYLQEDNSKEDTETVKEKEENVSSSSDPDVYHMKQYIHNACGTIALIHGIANNLDRYVHDQRHKICFNLYWDSVLLS